MQDKALDALRLFSVYRSILVKNKVLIEVAANEMRCIIKRDTTARWVFESLMRYIERLKKEIGTAKRKIHKTIMDNSLKDSYLLINFIKGVGMQIAIALFMHTNNFENTCNWQIILSEK